VGQQPDAEVLDLRQADDRQQALPIHLPNHHQHNTNTTRKTGDQTSYQTKGQKGNDSFMIIGVLDLQESGRVPGSKGKFKSSKMHLLPSDFCDIGAAS
jgi:hypothetical protein